MSILLILIGIALLGCGGFFFFRQRTWTAQALRAEGIVIELTKRRARGKYVWVKTEGGVNLEQKHLYRVVVRFRTESGRTIKFSPSITMRPAPYQVGERVPVLYHPDHPQQAQIDRFVYRWFSVLMLIFFGFFTIGMGFLVMVLLIV